MGFNLEQYGLNGTMLENAFRLPNHVPNLGNMNLLNNSIQGGELLFNSGLMGYVGVFRRLFVLLAAPSDTGYWNRKKFLKFFPKMTPYRGIFMREIDCAHSQTLKMLP